MKVGEWLKLYRQQHNLSMQALADLCGFSKAYINVLEKGISPKTGKPISPTIQTFEKIARGTKTDVDTLLKLLDRDQPVTVNANDDLSYSQEIGNGEQTESYTPEEVSHIKKYRALDKDGRELVDGLLDNLHSQKTDKLEDSSDEITAS